MEYIHDFNVVHGDLKPGGWVDMGSHDQSQRLPVPASSCTACPCAPVLARSANACCASHA